VIGSTNKQTNRQTNSEEQLKQLTQSWMASNIRTKAQQQLHRWKWEKCHQKREVTSHFELLVEFTVSKSQKKKQITTLLGKGEERNKSV